MSLNENGFLDENIKNFKSIVYEKYRDYFAFAISLNKFAHERKYTYSCNSRDGLLCYTNCLFLKVLNFYQASIILIEHGLPHEAIALSRCMCDPLYILKIFMDDPEFAKKYDKSRMYNTLKYIHIIKKNSHPVFKIARESITESTLDELKRELINFKPGEFKIEGLAIRAGMKPHYDTMFRIASDEVHSPSNAIAKYAKFDEAGEISEFSWGPSDNEADRILISITDMLLKAIQFTDKIHAKEKSEMLRRLEDKWKELDIKTI
jgi:hypothetical protein